MITYQSTPDFYNDYISHHGILGMHWGKRNGPPYPLGVGAGERKGGGNTQPKEKTARKLHTQGKTHEYNTKNGKSICQG